MDAISAEALSSLTAAIQALIPAGNDPALKPSCFVNPIRVMPTGLGGLAGLNDTPAGEILGRRLEALVLVTARGETTDQLNTTVSAITSAVAGAERKDLSKQGIQRIVLNEIRPKSVVDSGGKSISEQEVSFKVLYEFLKLPQQADGLISKVTLDMDVSTDGNLPVPVLHSDFMQGTLDWFEVFDTPNPITNKPSQWQYNPTEFRIEQLSNIWGGSPALTPNKSGTYLVLRTSPARPPVRDFLFKTMLQSDDNRGIGVVFRWQDIDNYYFFLMDATTNYRLLAKKVGGTFQNMDTPAMDTTQSYQPGTQYLVKIKASESDIEVYMDDALVLQAKDQSLLSPGRVGFMTHRNEKSYFYRIDLARL